MPDYMAALAFVMKDLKNPLNLPVDVPDKFCLFCSRAEWQEYYGMMVYMCDMSHCIKDEEHKEW